MGMKIRLELLKSIKNRMTHSLPMDYQHILEQRRFCGQLNINWKEKDLLLSFSKSNTVETQDMASLSGGEKSYVTLSFLLAIATHVEAPFKIFDEFDVFMDAQS